MRVRLALECSDTAPPFTRRHVTSFQSADMSAHSKPSTTRVAQKRKPGAYATFAPRPRKQKPVGKRFASPVETLTASPTEGQPLYGYGFAFLFFSFSVP